MKKLFFALTAGVLMAASACTSDPCKDVTCNNGGTCADGTCICAAGYEGNDCSTAVNAKFVGSWTATEACPATGTYGVNIIATSVAGAPSGVLIGNLGNYGCTSGSYEVPGTASGNTITVSGTVCSTSFTGTLNYAAVGTGATLTGTYSATYGSPSTTDNCTISMSK